uniref:Protein TIC 214 n=1 Tax=Solanum lycopersicum TaxID=4081 RepID=K4B5M5_SOLLC
MISLFYFALEVSILFLSYRFFSLNSNENEGFNRRTRTKVNDLTIRESSNDFEVTQKYKYLWV